MVRVKEIIKVLYTGFLYTLFKTRRVIANLKSYALRVVEKILVLFGLHARLIPIKPISFYRRGLSENSPKTHAEQTVTSQKPLNNSSERRVDDSPNTQERGVSNNNAKGMPRSLSNAGDSGQAEGNVSPEINGSLSQLPRVAERKIEKIERRDNVKKPKTGTPADVNPSESALYLEIAHIGGFSSADGAARDKKESPDCVAHFEKDVSSGVQSLKKEAVRFGEKPEVDEYIQAILAAATNMQPNGPNDCGFIEYAEKKSDAILLGVAILMNQDPQGFGVTGEYAASLLSGILDIIDISNWKAPGSKEKQDLLDVFGCFEVGTEKQRDRIIELQSMVKNSIEGQASTTTISVSRSLDAELNAVSDNKTNTAVTVHGDNRKQRISEIFSLEAFPGKPVKPNFMDRDGRQASYEAGSDLWTHKTDYLEDIDLEEGNDKPEYAISSENDRPIFPIFDFVHKLLYMGEGSAQQPSGAFWSLWSSTPSDLRAVELEAGLSDDGPDHRYRAIHNRESLF